MAVNGRLFRQAIRLAKHERRGVILLEGGARNLGECRMSREAIQGALITLTVFLGLPLLRARDADESARLLELPARQGRCVAEGSMARPAKRPKNRRALQLHILQSLPGIGPTRAARLLKRFGSVEAVLAAEAAQLEEVAGVGRETARRIRWAVRETSARYIKEPH